MNYEKVRLRSSQFESVTQLTVEEFDKLLPVFTTNLKRLLRFTTRGKTRVNKLTYPASLDSPSDILFFTLTYLKLNPLQEQHGASFDLSQESVSRWIRIGLSALNDSLKEMGHNPLRDGYSFAETVKKKQETEPNSIIKEHGEHYFLDASDIGVQRPKDETDQEEKYSGKHHKHTIKNSYICNEQSEVLFLGFTYSGKVHDKKMIDEDEVIFPDNSFLWKDLGYQGYLPSNVQSFEPFKKPKNGELTKFQKQENQAISRVRIVIEHAIGSVKRCRIVKEIIRLYDFEIRDRVIETCVALHNFRLSCRKGYKINSLFEIG